MSIFKRLFAPARIPLEDQLATLADCGIRLRPKFGIATMLEFFDRERYETNPYYGLVIAMGGESNREPHEPLSDNVWHLDTECIEGHGDYRRIAERMRDLAQGELPIENIRDHVDATNGDAWVAFELNGETIEWHARVQDDWIDPNMLSNFCALLASQNKTRRFTYFDLKGQDCLIGCASEEELVRLRKETGLKFAWME